MALLDYALCVGINRYPGITPLNGADFDATAFHTWATTTGGVKPADAALVVSSQFPPAVLVADEAPAAAQIWAFFEKLRAAANANNDAMLGRVAGRRLYMFFSGHGFSPSIDASGVLLANAERETPHNLSAKAWADRFYENGLVEEVLLFQDACREPVVDVDLTPPYLTRALRNGIQTRKRFYAFAARSPLLAVEKPIGGQVRGVFSATLLAGLDGAARDPQTGAIWAEDLKRYLSRNMIARLDQAEIDDPDICQRPEVFQPDDFEIVPAPAAPLGGGVVPGPGPGGGMAPGPAPPGGGAPGAEAAVAIGAAVFPVKVALAAPGGGAQILDHARKVVATVAPGVAAWDTALPIGLFELVAPGQDNRLFRVLGAVGADGAAEVVNVS